MSKYLIVFQVEGDWIADNYVEVVRTEADNLEELAKQTYGDYKQALWYIWKKMESSISMEPKPNKLLKIDCFCEFERVPEGDILNEFFKIRVNKFKEDHPIFNAPQA